MTGENWEALHAAAVLQLLGMNEDIPAVFENGVPRGNNLKTYTAVYNRTEFTRDAPANALDGAQNAILHTATVYAVAPTVGACRVVLFQVRQALLGKRPIIAGRSCGLIKQVDSQDPRRDDTTGGDVFSATTVFEFPST